MQLSFKFIEHGRLGTYPMQQNRHFLKVMPIPWLTSHACCSCSDTGSNLTDTVPVMPLQTHRTHISLYLGGKKSLYVTFSTHFTLYATVVSCTCIELFGPQNRRVKCVRLSVCFDNIIHHKWNTDLKASFHTNGVELWPRKDDTWVKWLTKRTVSKQSRTTYRSQDFVTSGSRAPVRLLWALVEPITTKHDGLGTKHTSHNIHCARIQCETPSRQHRPGTFAFWKVCKPRASM